MSETLIQVKERPILMGAPMVRALLAGTKTQTRRAIKPQPEYDADMLGGVYMFTPPKGMGSDTAFAYAKNPAKSALLLATCPYGQPGDRLWVRETFWEYGQWVQLGVTEAGKKVRSFAPTGIKARPIRFVAPDENTYVPGEKSLQYYKRPSIFMPRAASRLLLEITAVRVERVQAISEADAVAEGIESRDGKGFYWRDYELKNGWHANHPVMSYETLWRSINGPESWAENPWVWAVEFKVIKPTA